MTPTLGGRRTSVRPQQHWDKTTSLAAAEEAERGGAPCEEGEKEDSSQEEHAEGNACKAPLGAN